MIGKETLISELADVLRSHEVDDWSDVQYAIGAAWRKHKPKSNRPPGVILPDDVGAPVSGDMVEALWRRMKLRGTFAGWTSNNWCRPRHNGWGYVRVPGRRDPLCAQITAVIRGEES